MIKADKTSFWEKTLVFLSFFLLFKQLNVFFPSSFMMYALLLGSIIAFFIIKRGMSHVYLWLIPYFLILLVNFYSGDVYFDSLGDVLQEVLLLFFSSALFYCVVDGKRDRFAQAIVFLAMISFIYYSITSFLIEIVSPGVIRNTVYMINLGELEDLSSLYKRGLATYQLPHALPILIPPLVMQSREKSSSLPRRIFSLITLLSIFVIVFISYAATALFLSGVIFVLALFIKSEPSQKGIVRLIVISIIVLPLLLNANAVLQPLLSVFGHSDETSYVDKLMDIETLAQSRKADGSVAAREAKYAITFQEILENPFLGTNEATGNHSAIFDRWAALGMVGWVPYICFVIMQFRSTMKRLDKKRRLYYYLGVLAAMIMLATKNMSNWETWFMVFTILPLMIWNQSKRESQLIN